jgi:hypothetical protein
MRTSRTYAVSMPVAWSRPSAIEAGLDEAVLNHGARPSRWSGHCHPARLTKTIARPSRRSSIRSHQREIRARRRGRRRLLRAKFGMAEGLEYALAADPVDPSNRSACSQRRTHLVAADGAETSGLRLDPFAPKPPGPRDFAAFLRVDRALGSKPRETQTEWRRDMNSTLR